MRSRRRSVGHTCLECGFRWTTRPEAKEHNLELLECFKCGGKAILHKG